MAATEVTAYGVRHKPEPDRYSTILGQRVKIMQPVGVPKAREDCQPFTFELYDASDAGYSRGAEVVKAQEKFVKELGALAKPKRKTRGDRHVAAFLRVRFR